MLALMIRLCAHPYHRVTPSPVRLMGPQRPISDVTQAVCYSHTNACLCHLLARVVFVCFALTELTTRSRIGMHRLRASVVVVCLALTELTPRNRVEMQHLRALVVIAYLALSELAT